MKNPLSISALVLMCLAANARVGEGPAAGDKKQGEMPLLMPATLDADTAKTDTAQAEEKSFPLTFGFDLASRYIWRGVDFGMAPAFQPGLKYRAGRGKVTFDLGAWASYSVNGSFAEMDLYATLNLPYVWVGVIDYFFPVEASGDDQYYDYGSNTLHVFEGLVGFSGHEKFPLTAFFAYNFHSPVTDPDNSLYFELGYPFSLRRDVTLSLSAGAAHGAYYTQNGEFNVVNVGLKASKSFSIKDKVVIPLSVALITNPDAEKLYFVATVGLWNQ